MGIITAVVLPSLTAICPVSEDGDTLIASPADTAQTSALLRAAAEHNLTVVARGAGTGWVRPRADLVVDTRAMDKVVEHVAGDLVATVQAGATMGHVAQVLATAGQRLALDVPPEVTVGGMLATGLAGPLRFRYGSPRDLLIGITVVRADGIVAHSGGKVVKNVAGYDLGKLFTGSHGTLGLITEATFRLHPIPQSTAYLTASAGSSLSRSQDWAALASVVAAAANSPLQASAVELDVSDGIATIGVLLEGTKSGVADRATAMADLLAPAGVGATGAGAPYPRCIGGWGAQPPEITDAPPPWWGRFPAPTEAIAASASELRGSPGSGAAAGPSRPGDTVAGTVAGGGSGERLPPRNTVVRVTFWLRSLADVLAAIASSGIRCTVRGSAGAGMLYIYAEDGTDAGGVVAALRSVVADRGGVVVLTEPPRAGSKLMRAVKDQFDPGHRMRGSV